MCVNLLKNLHIDWINKKSCQRCNAKVGVDFQASITYHNTYLDLILLKSSFLKMLSNSYFSHPEIIDKFDKAQYLLLGSYYLCL